MSESPTVFDDRPLRSGAALFDLTGRGAIHVKGRDRYDFLQGLVTNDVKKLAAGSGCHAALLTPKGRMVADLVVLDTGETLEIDCEPSLVEALPPMLSKFIFFQQVEIEDRTPQTAVFHLAGPDAETSLGRLGIGALPFDPHHHVSATIGSVPVEIVYELRTGAIGFDVRTSRVNAEDVKKILTGAGGEPSPSDLFEAARIEACIPRWGADLDESVMPNEAWFERDAISYSKGCYIGQEIVARLKTYGHVNRHLVGLHVEDGKEIAPGDELYANEAKVGAVTSVARSARLQKVVALAFVKREFEERGTPLSVRAASGDVPAAVVTIPLGR
ncbi:MAG TPA: glycine cleavage T C-terminal barrel domain-containing protein [Thermoanaerobaculia bacterium]|nr:glycine cleavage T C-terminal barrel domain-containing protein [Thermoanaerobaculia bacterium]